MASAKEIEDNEKKKSTLYKERNEEDREKFRLEISNISADNLVWVDECGVEEVSDRTYARAPSGEKVIGNIAGKKVKRISVIAAYSQKKKLTATLRFRGYTNTAAFETWVKSCLLPVLEPGEKVILDNAAFHKSANIRAMIEKAGASLLFLPPYSPDLNKIEHQWATLKARIRRHKNDYSNFTDNLDQQLINMGTCISN